MGTPTSGKFEIRAKRFFLTYPRTTKKFSPESLLDRLKEKVTIEDYTISQEMHQDVSTRPYHLHALLEFEERLYVRRADFFDVKYYNHVYHPNVQKARSRRKVLDYVTKDGNFITSLPETRDEWRVLVEDCLTYECLLECLLRRNRNVTSYVTINLIEKLWKQKRGLTF